MPAEITLTDQVDPEVVARLGRELSRFNFDASGVRDGVEFFAAVRDDDGELVAAVDGWSWGGTGWVEHLWVDELPGYPGGHSFFLMRRPLD